MSDSAQRYYIPVALTVDGVNEEALDSNNTQVPLSGREVDIATSPSQEYGDDSGELHISNEKLTDSEISSSGEPTLSKNELWETRQDDGEGEDLGESEYDDDGDEDEYDDDGEEGEYDDRDEDEYDDGGDEYEYDGRAKTFNSELVPLADLHQSRNHSTQATESRDSTHTESRDSTHPPETRFDRDATLEIDDLEVSTTAVFGVF
jgi:hypothetical protein